MGGLLPLARRGSGQQHQQLSRAAAQLLDMHAEGPSMHSYKHALLTIYIYNILKRLHLCFFSF